jgi:hypothetical protein
MPGRRVRRLALRAPSEALARRTSIALEDALHTASLPGGDGSRVIVIRRLALGRIRADMSPAQLALAIERRVWELESTAVHARDGRASDASVVFFRDAAEPYVLLARRLGRRQAASEWFWPAAVRGWRPNLALHDSWRDLVGAVSRLEAALAIVAQIVRVLVEDGTCDTLCAAMRPGDGAAWLLWCGWSRATSPARVAAASRRVDALAPGAVACLGRWAATWGADDDRTVWLAAVLLIAGRQSHVADPDVIVRATRLIASIVLQGSPAPASERPASDAPFAREGHSTHHIEQVDREPRSGDAVPPPTEFDCRGVRSGDGLIAAPDAKDSARLGSLGPARLSDGAMTSFAGLFFAIQLLNRLGIAAALDEQPEWIAADLPGRILDRVADFARIPMDDPVMQALAQRRPARETSDERIESVVAHWIAAMRRWCWRHPRLRLRALVSTPGRLSATETHVDVRFAHGQADIRVRKTGLDLDPGWVPWLGIVVRFHYEFGEPFHG